MAVSEDGEGEATKGQPVCQHQHARQVACDLLLEVAAPGGVAEPQGSAELRLLARLAAEFVEATPAPVGRSGEDEWEYDPEKRGDYGDSTASKLRNDTALAGLTNQGNTCYMNSVLQQLYGAPAVVRAILDAPLALRLRVENRAPSLAAGVEVTLQPSSDAPAQDVRLTGEQPLGLEATSELSRPIAAGSYSVRVACEGRVIAQQHDFGTGVHTVVLTDKAAEGEGEGAGGTSIEQAVRAEPLLTEVHRTFSFMEEGAAACVDTTTLCDSLHGWRSAGGGSFLEYPIRSQNDAAEFLGKIIDTLNGDLKGSASAAALERALTCKTMVEKQCQVCKRVGRGPEETRVLFPVMIESAEQRFGSVQQALEHAARPEVMSGVNAVQCETCAAKTSTSYTACVTQLPSVLLLQLGRFMQNMYGEYRKSNHRVSFPQRIDMRAHTTTPTDEAAAALPPAWYELTGVVLHSGTHRAGHYTSLVKHGGRWVNFDDQHASVFDGDLEDVCFGGEEEVTQSWGGSRTHKREKSKNAYILMYRAEAEADDAPAPAPEPEQAGLGLPPCDAAPDSATMAVRRELREALQTRRATLERQQRLYDLPVLGLVRRLVAAVVDPHSALVRAVGGGDMAEARRLLRQGVDPDGAAAGSAHTPLMRAALDRSSRASDTRVLFVSLPAFASLNVAWVSGRRDGGGAARGEGRPERDQGRRQGHRLPPRRRKGPRRLHGGTRQRGRRLAEGGGAGAHRQRAGRAQRPRRRGGVLREA